MRAVVVNEFGPIGNAVLGEAPAPAPGPRDLLVEVHATAANYVDLVLIGGKHQSKPPLPFIPGKGPAGIVRAVGAEAAGFAVGDRVLAMCEPGGGFAELIAVPATQCHRIPDAMPFADAASMALVYDTAWFSLRERGRYQPGETVLVLGATGGVGLAAIQLAKALGAKVLAGAANPAKFDMARAAGADAIIDLGRPDLHESLRDQVYAVTDGRGADIIIDPLGDAIFDAAIRALAWCGRMVVIGFAAGRIPTLKVNYLLVRNIDVTGLQIGDYRKRVPHKTAACFAELFALYEAGRIRALPTTTLPIARIGDALRAIEDRSARGRIVLLQDR
ncbi:MAG: NADPH:quinone oxidoreductase family protein [Rhodospirillales bacterium]